MHLVFDLVFARTWLKKEKEKGTNRKLQKNCVQTDMHTGILVLKQRERVGASNSKEQNISLKQQFFFKNEKTTWTSWSLIYLIDLCLIFVPRKL